MVGFISFALLSFQTILLFLSAFYVYRIYQFNRLNRAWAVLFFGIFLMGVRSLFNFIIEFGVEPRLTPILELFDSRILPFLIALAIFWGLLSLKHTFQYFDFVEKKVKQASLNVKRKK